MELRFAKPSDLAAIQNLLSKYQLPIEDISGHIENFIIARDEKGLVGVIGLEVHGPYGLVRSFAVVSSHRGQGLGNRLFETLLTFARLKGIQELYLFTDTAERFFLKKGFAKIARASLPVPIRATQEYISLCPTAVVCMFRKLESGTRSDPK